MKIIANYLPQFHRIPENDEWWGQGYTDWDAVKKAAPQFRGHIQPRIPLMGQYCLDNPDTIRTQARLAREYGIYGFGIYHYWFSSGQNLLTKPAELLLENKDIDINFMFIWDNSSWKRSWSGVKGNDWAPKFDESAAKNSSNGILAELKYGNEKEWKTHFDYLLPFFQDERYIKIDGKPIFGFMQPGDQYETIKCMTSLWGQLAQTSSLRGVSAFSIDKFTTRFSNSKLDYSFRYTPFQPQSLSEAIELKFKIMKSRKLNTPQWFDYDKLWKRILDTSRNAHDDSFLSGFVSFDDTPRRGCLARIVKGANPDKFEEYFTELLRISKAQNKEFVFLSAWNEWGEGMYLEPDTLERYGYLNAVRNSLENYDKR